MAENPTFTLPLAAALSVLPEAPAAATPGAPGPFAFADGARTKALIEQAGGAASTGRMRMMDVQPTGLHQRVPVFMGSKTEVETAVKYHLDFDAKNA